MIDPKLRYNKDPICPYCEHLQRNCNELNLLDGESEIEICDGCGKDFRVTCDIDVTYHSEKVVEEE